METYNDIPKGWEIQLILRFQDLKKQKPAVEVVREALGIFWNAELEKKLIKDLKKVQKDIKSLSMA